MTSNIENFNAADLPSQPDVTSTRLFESAQPVKLAQISQAQVLQQGSEVLSTGTLEVVGFAAKRSLLGVAVVLSIVDIAKAAGAAKDWHDADQSLSEAQKVAEQVGLKLVPVHAKDGSYQLEPIDQALKNGDTLITREALAKHIAEVNKGAGVFSGIDFSKIPSIYPTDSQSRVPANSDSQRPPAPLSADGKIVIKVRETPPDVAPKQEILPETVKPVPVVPAKINPGEVFVNKVIGEIGLDHKDWITADVRSQLSRIANSPFSSGALETTLQSMAAEGMSKDQFMQTVAMFAKTSAHAIEPTPPEQDPRHPGNKTRATGLPDRELPTTGSQIPDKPVSEETKLERQRSMDELEGKMREQKERDDSWGIFGELRSPKPAGKPPWEVLESSTVDIATLRNFKPAANMHMGGLVVKAETGPEDEEESEKVDHNKVLEEIEKGREEVENWRRTEDELMSLYGNENDHPTLSEADLDWLNDQ